METIMLKWDHQAQMRGDLTVGPSKAVFISTVSEMGCFQEWTLDNSGCLTGTLVYSHSPKTYVSVSWIL